MFAADRTPLSAPGHVVAPAARLPWQVGALGSCLALDIEDPVLDAELRTLLADLRSELRGDVLSGLLDDQPPDDVGCADPEPVVVRGHGPWQVSSLGHSGSAASAAEALSAVLTAVNLTAVASTPWLALHAAVLARDGAALVLPGRSGLGKTTTTAALLAQGWEYLSDEALCLRWTDGAVRAYPRPLALSPWAAAHLDVTGTPGQDEVLVRPHQLGGAVATGPVQVRHVVLLDRDGGTPRLTPTHRAQTLEALLRRGFTTAHDPARALSMLSDALRTASSWTLRLGDPTAAARLLTERLG